MAHSVTSETPIEAVATPIEVVSTSHEVPSIATETLMQKNKKLTMRVSRQKKNHRHVKTKDKKIGKNDKQDQKSKKTPKGPQNC